MRSQTDYSKLDKQIAEVLTCKPLPEAEVRVLCEKVYFI